MFNNAFCNFVVIHFKRRQTTQPIKSNVYLTKNTEKIMLHTHEVGFIKWLTLTC